MHSLIGSLTKTQRSVNEGCEEEVEEERLTTEQLIAYSIEASGAYVGMGGSGDGMNHFKSNTLRSPITASRTPAGSQQVAFLSSQREPISSDRVVSGKKHCYVSNLTGFDVYTTAETRSALENATENLMRPQINLGNNSTATDHWKLIETFFDGIPLFALDDDTQEGAGRFARYVQVMWTLKDAIRKSIYLEYVPGKDPRSLTPFFIALEDSRKEVQALTAELRHAQQLLQQSVGHTKEEVVSAFKGLPAEEQNDLRQYFSKQVSFKFPSTPPMQATRHYGENRPYDKEFMNIEDDVNISPELPHEEKKSIFNVNGNRVVNSMENERLNNALREITLERNQYKDLFEALDAKFQAELEQKSHRTRSALVMIARSLKQGLNIHDETETVAASASANGNVDVDRLVREANKMSQRAKLAEKSLAQLEQMENSQKNIIARLCTTLKIKNQNIFDLEDQIAQRVAVLVEHGPSEEDIDLALSKKTKKEKKALMSDRFKFAVKQTKHANRFSKMMSNLKKTQVVPENPTLKALNAYLKASAQMNNSMPFYHILNSASKKLKKTTGIANDRKCAYLIGCFYHDKIITNYHFDSLGRDHVSMPTFLKSFFIRRCGEKALAVKRLELVVSCAQQNRKTNARMDTFAMLIGLEKSDVECYTPLAGTYYLNVLTEACSVLTKTDPKASYKMEHGELEYIKHCLGDGSKTRMLNRNQAFDIFQRIGLDQKVAEKHVQRLSKHGLWVLDDFLHYVMQEWLALYKKRKLSSKGLFLRADENGDGILSLDEFRNIVKQVEPTTTDIDVVALYDLISGEDGVIDEEEFAVGIDMVHAQVMRAARMQKIQQRLHHKRQKSPYK